MPAGRYNVMDMRSRNFSTTRLIAALGAAACLAFPALASAQQPYGDQQPYGGQPPPYAQPPPTYGNQPAIKGTLSGFDGQWTVYMRDDKGYTDHITLHQGTIINPTGIKLLEGMRATVYGYADGPTFQANRVDVAYSPYSPYYGGDGNPAYGYGDPGYGYGGYGGYGYGGYGYGYPYVGLGIGINWGWGWGWGWPGYWGYPGYWGGWGGYCCGYYGGGYYRGPYYHGPYYRSGTVGAPVRGGYYGHGYYGGPHGGTVNGGGGHAPVSSGSVHGGGGGRPPRR
ncbi:MAG: hypothetical protein JOZ77_02320 [Candidatus Eremiobacteraeota bacterium]|nr:hypothetical protein [Candidatus Eremiobacteraeota bacterium]